MPTSQCWHQQGQSILLSGRWTHERVAEVWDKMPRSGIVSVDLAEVEQLDSALLTLLLRLSSLHSALTIRGAKASILSLLELYNLTELFVIEPE
jgi:ABC-type transporter Mla MlaB component